jgi:hypothetical protein
MRMIVALAVIAILGVKHPSIANASNVYLHPPNSNQGSNS